MNVHRLELVSLSLFSLVARSGSITNGAALAHLAVAAASKRIMDLEAAVGVALFERHSRGITLTAAGTALLQHAQRILKDVDLLSADLSDYAAGVVGVVRLSANTSAVTQFLPMEIAAFAQANPQIRIELEELNSDQVAMAVVDGRADFGILAGGTPVLGLQTMLYRRDRLVLVVPERHPLAERRTLALADAVEYDFVSLSQSTSLAGLLEAAATSLGKRLKVRIRVRSFDAMCMMVAANLGIALLPAAAVRAHLPSMGLREIAMSDEWARRELLICARDLNALPRSARLFVNHLSETPA